jgi:phage terminase large subunit-like protein
MRGYDFRYVEQIKSGEIIVCNEQRLLIDHIEKCFATEDIYIDVQLMENYLGLVKYFPYEQIFPWEEFVLALWDCTFYRATGLPRWPDLFCLVGRGAGKDGYIALDSFCVTSVYCGIPQYNVDICANNEEQAMTPVEDIVNVLEDPKNRKKLVKFYKWTKERVKSIDTGAIVRGRTNNPKGKDGLRSGKVIFNEIHQYENYSNIDVFTTGLGKKPHPRRGFFTTDGYVRDGLLDDLKDQSMRILNGEEPDNGLLPFICRLDDKDEVHDPVNWQKANPSLPYRLDLQREIEKEYREWKLDPGKLPAFMTKRMNIHDGNPEMEVTAQENVAATKKEIPDLTGRTCVCGIDFAKVTDFASINLHFLDGDTRYDINHSWLCLRSADLPRIKAPWQEWAEKGFITVVDDVEISPYLITQWIMDARDKYVIPSVAIDSFRYALLARALRELGYEKDAKNLKLVKPGDVMAASTVIDSCFANQNFVWGNNPPLRWAVSNTKLVRSSRSIGSDTGNFYYAKVEGRSRKTDPFMALVSSMTLENELDTEDFEEPEFYVMAL